MDTFEQARDFFLRGVAHYEAQRFAEAESNFAAALALVPGRASTLTNLGATRLHLGKFQDAADLLEEALAKEPDNLQALGHRATALAELNQHPQALACAERALQLDPQLGQMWSLRGNLLKDVGRSDEAIVSLQRAIACGADTEINRYCLASLAGGDTTLSPPRSYVEGLFDGYADGFETHLVQVLKYQVPQALADRLKRMDRSFSRALDLGCGTGLCGPLVRPLAARLDGVDLSANMVRRAASLGVYDDVVQADVVQYLAASPNRYELVLAADVFVYLGALDAVFEGVARVMAPGGVFCFSVEAAQEGKPLALRPSMRYAHSRGYIEQLAERNGFNISCALEHPIREDQRVPIPGLLFWLVKR